MGENVSAVQLRWSFFRSELLELARPNGWCSLCNYTFALKGRGQALAGPDYTFISDLRGHRRSLLAQERAKRFAVRFSW